MGHCRSLTCNERSVAESIFRGSVPLSDVEIVVRARLYGGFTPYGTINVGPESYAADYIAPTLATAPRADLVEDAHFFLHEMTHVWQHFVGMPVALAWARARAEGRRVLRRSGKPRFAFYRDAATYAYSITSDRADLLDYNMEQQCEIVADYFAHRLWGRALAANSFNVFGYPTPSPDELRSVLGRFLSDPAYPSREPGLWHARARFRRHGAAEEGDEDECDDAE